MQEPKPILVSHLFPEMLDHLIQLLDSLVAKEWEETTVCAGWSVNDVALHLLGGQVGNLSRRRDRFSPPAPALHDQADLLAFVNDLNTSWVQATQRISPRLLCDLLRFTGSQLDEYFQSLDPHALGGPVSWAGPEPAPLWLDLAREYTEFWHHQQHIRDAVGRPGLKEPRFFGPALDAFVRALPHTYRDVKAKEGTLIALTLRGDAGGRWFLLREKAGWCLYLGVSQQPDAEASIDQDDAWRIFTRGLAPDEAQAKATFRGDKPLAAKVLEMVSIIA